MDSVVVSLLGYVVPFLIILTIVVFVHEYGHYWVARRNGVRVDVFSVGFGKELFGYTDRHGTRWRFSLIPLGGYVRMHGDADETSATADSEAALDPDSFPAKTVGQRMAIVFAGPAINFIFAIVVMALLFTFSGRPFAPAIVDELTAGGAAEASGLLVGDRITAIDGTEVGSFAEVQEIVRVSADVELLFAIERDGSIIEVPVTPQFTEFDDRFGTTHKVGLIGVRTNQVEVRTVGPATAVVDAFGETWRIVAGTLTALGEMIAGSRSTEELGGPLRIAQMSGTIAADGIVPAIWFTAVLSINLGLINLFPIPMLDGGHLVLYAIEAVRGKALTERMQEYAFRFGLAMVLSLMVFATWNDLVNLKVIEFVSGLIS